MSWSGPGATHHLACDCREAEWAARLAASEKAREEAERERDEFASAEDRERTRAECALVAIAAAESRAARLEEALAPFARIAEIVAEGKRLERPNEPGPKGQRAVFWAEHASLLLAVAEAADKREATLRAAAREALDVLTRLADSAAYWSDYDVPVGLVAEVDSAKARLAGVLGD